MLALSVRKAKMAGLKSPFFFNTIKGISYQEQNNRRTHKKELKIRNLLLAEFYKVNESWLQSADHKIWEVWEKKAEKQYNLFILIDFHQVMK